MGPAPVSPDSSSTAPSRSPESKASAGSLPRRSLFSRLTLPVRSRTKIAADFHVRPVEPHRKYAAGDVVRGAVVLTLVKPVRITHLTVSLHGYVRVWKQKAAPEAVINPAEIPSSRGGSKFKYHGNGFASLFEDEQVLSADGRLDPGKYEFEFELMFPNTELPTSIDFERGTITYAIIATLTRPSTSSPIICCERKISLQDRLDIAGISSPQPRTISLEPITKRTKRKRTGGGADSPVTGKRAEPAGDGDSTRAAEPSTEGSSTAGDEPSPQRKPRSPAQSDVRSLSGESGESTGSGSTSRSRGDGNQAGLSGSSSRASEERTIKATIELPRGGCLPGDILPVKISVQHVKRIKSLHGVIVTVFRQGRIDMQPPLVLYKELSKEDRIKMEKEDYYPKSKTGLGGLSFSSSGCSLFRKDLCQAFSPLIIDPATLTASVTTSVRIPADSFPTVSGVPGDMVTFKYHLEVIVDLGGKLATQIQGGNSLIKSHQDGVLGNQFHAGGQVTPWSSRVIDTDRFRRQKGVISVNFDLVVGTTDSARTSGRSQIKRSPTVPLLHPPTFNPGSGHGNMKRVLSGFLQEEEDGQEMYDHGHMAYAHRAAQQHLMWHPEAIHESVTPEYVPRPILPDDSLLSEKERIKQAEQRLLPSQPEAPVAGPSASAPTVQDDINAVHIPSAPLPPSPTLRSPGLPTEDKQELERQRLLAEASAPPDFPDDHTNGAAVASSDVTSSLVAEASASPAGLEASAPVLADEDEYGPCYTYGPSPRHVQVGQCEQLPRYER